MKTSIKDFLTYTLYTFLFLLSLAACFGAIALFFVGVGLQHDTPANVWYVILSVVLGCSVIGIGGAWSDYKDRTADKTLTEHTCNVCGDSLKKGEGTHYPSDDKEHCYCLCPTCLPTVIFTPPQK